MNAMFDRFGFNRYNILLAMDEVQTGYGRTGENFAHQLYGIQPDLMGCGKAAGGGILPVSFVSGRDDVIKVLTPGSEGSTFGGYPLACVVSIYAMKSLIDENFPLVILSLTILDIASNPTALIPP